MSAPPDNPRYVNPGQPPQMVKRPLRPRPEWTVEVGPSGFHLTDGKASVYVDLGEIATILADGTEFWSSDWRGKLQAALEVRESGL